MEKRYQVFVSSTYVDLIKEREIVIKTLLEFDCIPAGMELFPATDEKQFDYIKKVIDNSDYYLIIVGGRYGSISNDGISYTEKEYEYALKKGIKVIVLLHSDPDNLPFKKSEINEETRQKLINFREKLQKGRIVKKWKNASEIASITASSLRYVINNFPAVGWIRADVINQNEKNQNTELYKQIADYDNIKLMIAKLLESTTKSYQRNQFDEKIEIINNFDWKHNKIDQFEKHEEYFFYYMYENTRKATRKEIEEFYEIYSMNGGNIKDIKRSDWRIVINDCYILPLYGAKSMDIIVPKNIEAKLTPLGPGHNDIYFLKKYKSTQQRI